MNQALNKGSKIIANNHDKEILDNRASLKLSPGCRITIITGMPGRGRCSLSCALHCGGYTVNAQKESLTKIFIHLPVFRLIPPVQQFDLKQIKRVGKHIPEYNRVLNDLSLIQDLFLFCNIQNDLAGFFQIIQDLIVKLIRLPSHRIHLSCKSMRTCQFTLCVIYDGAKKAPLFIPLPEGLYQ